MPRSHESTACPCPGEGTAARGAGVARERPRLAAADDEPGGLRLGVFFGGFGHLGSSFDDLGRFDGLSSLGDGFSLGGFGHFRGGFGDLGLDRCLSLGLDGFGGLFDVGDGFSLGGFGHFRGGFGDLGLDRCLSLGDGFGLDGLFDVGDHLIDRPCLDGHGIRRRVGGCSVLLSDLLSDLREGCREGVVDTALGLLDGLRAVVATTLATGPALTRRPSRGLLRLLEAQAEAMALGIEGDRS